MWIWEALLNLLFPCTPQCPLCGSRGTEGVCEVCRQVLAVFRRRGVCACCGRYPERGEVPPGALCAICRKVSWPFVAARGAGPFESLLRKAIHRFKYGGRRSLAPVLGELMAEAAREESLFRAVEVCVPVPLTPARLNARGFNQAELLAREVGRRLGLEVVGALARVRETPPQVGLTRGGRAANIEGALVPLSTHGVRGRRVLLVDDVFTTGATAAASARALLRGGALEVYVLTAATVAQRGVYAQLNFDAGSH
ncbi:MAG: Phosphoribosyltransferase [Clostridia bacterium 62_21]|nr:MAG: Phosphoribosyltransferase [Clostridia bacterium 62_21]